MPAIARFFFLSVQRLTGRRGPAGSSCPDLVLGGHLAHGSFPVLLFVLVFKSLIYALVVSEQSCWQPQPEAALRILGRLISRWAGLLALGAVGRAGV